MDDVKCSTTVPIPLNFFEFFAGGGMARLGLGKSWNCAFANDICEKKAAAYRAFYGESPELVVEDVAKLSSAAFPGTATLVWASFPCQDLSLAGSGAGLKGGRSGTFKSFWKLIRTVIAERRQPKMIVLENVVGTLSSHGGKDFETIISCLVEEGYKVGCLIIDAVRFLPQSRPRLFIVAVHSSVSIPSILRLPAASEPWHPAPLRNACGRLPKALRDQLLWWRLPIPGGPVPAFSSLIENEPAGVRWHTKEETERIIRLMSSIHRKKLDKAMSIGARIVGTAYKRSRPNEQGLNVQRAEIRFDQISGCLRTPVGGSSRQTIFVVEGASVRSRLLSPREAARLMGVPDHYPLPKNYNDAYHVFGDGVAVPVVGWLSEHLLLPLALYRRVGKAA